MPIFIEYFMSHNGNGHLGILACLDPCYYLPSKVKCELRRYSNPFYCSGFILTKEEDKSDETDSTA